MKIYAITKDGKFISFEDKTQLIGKCLVKNGNEILDKHVGKTIYDAKVEELAPLIREIKYKSNISKLLEFLELERIKPEEYITGQRFKI